MTGYYILDGTQPVPCDDSLAWGHWFEVGERQVALTEIGEGIQVSTVFLGLDHNFSGKGPPVLFETMAFREVTDREQRWSLDDFTQRYCTWQKAEQGHEAVCAAVRAWCAEQRATLWRQEPPQP